MSGKIIKYGDNIDTDVIIPARYLNTSNPDELKDHCMEDIDSDFAKKVNKGDIIVAGKNFGCGSSREHAPIAIRASGISLVVAESFARIFFRNAINIGLPIVECKEFARACEEGDTASFDLEMGILRLENKKLQFKTIAFPDEIKRIIDANGLLNYIRGV